MERQADPKEDGSDNQGDYRVLLEVTGSSMAARHHLTRNRPSYSAIKGGTFRCIKLALPGRGRKIAEHGDQRTRIPPAGNPKLLVQVCDGLRRELFSWRTEQAYLGWIRRFFIFHDKRAVVLTTMLVAMF